ncbi:FGGY-family carbohydrate kinase [Demetria terragena]|uniref:FGGY-family carbohydrate kinase n=1 Tax=Demetria terragena TaxID=63959 RepID=UPI00037456E4|nr:FGGY family carbohydrate kinase [Demetria terragena]
MQELLAGLDVGTSSVKVALVDAAGVEVAHSRRPTQWIRTPDGVEADAAAILSASHEALELAVNHVPDARIVAVGVASMAEAGVLVDRDGRVLAPVIAWHDRRDVAQLDDLVAQLGGRSFSQMTGLPVWTQWSLTKHRWMVDHLPQVRTAARRYAIAEWVVRGLGGNPGTELSLASRTGWLGLRSKQLWPEAVEWSGATPSILADVVPAGTPAGTIGVDHPVSQLRGAVLTVAGHDHQAAAVGVGATSDHAELDSCGTAEALVRTIPPDLTEAALDALTGAGVTVGWHVVADRWSVLGATEGGLTLQTVMQRLGVAREQMAALDVEANGRGSSPTSIQVGASGDEVVIAGSQEPADVWSAAIRTVTDQAHALSETISRAAGPRGRLVVTGGWSNSAALMAAKRAAFGPVDRVAVTEAGARGAALMAGLAAGTYARPSDFPVAEG